MKAEYRIRIILNQWHIVSSSQRSRIGALLSAQADPQRVVKVGDQYHQARSGFLFHGHMQRLNISAGAQVGGDRPHRGTAPDGHLLDPGKRDLLDHCWLS